MIANLEEFKPKQKWMIELEQKALEKLKQKLTDERYKQACETLSENTIRHNEAE